MSAWTGPRESDWETPAQFRLRAPVPGERWPYGPPDDHQSCCILHQGGRYCDCTASAEDTLCEICEEQDAAFSTDDDFDLCSDCRRLLDAANETDLRQNGAEV